MAKRIRPTRNSTSTASLAAPEFDTEFANRLQDPFETAYMGVLRTNDPLLLERGQGNVQLYRELKRDGKVFDGLQKRQLALIGKAWQVEPVDADAPNATKDAETLTAILKESAFDRVCSELLEALLAGYAVAEIIWTIRNDMIVPKRIVKRAQRRFVYVQEDENEPPQLRMLKRENMLTGVPVPDRKFIVHRVNPEDDNPYGTGLGLQLYWPVFFKRKGIVAWNKLCDRFGSPTLHGKYPRSAGPKEKGTMADALRAFSSDGFVMTPEGMEIALLESKLNGNVTTQQALCEYMDDWIGAVLTGQESRNKGGGAVAAASKEREDVREDLTQADSDLLSETVNESLLAWICDYNGLVRCQVYRKVKDDDDRKAESEVDKNVTEMGFELSVDAVRAKYGEGWEKKAPAPIPAAPGLPRRAGQGAPAAAANDEGPAMSAANFAEPGGWADRIARILGDGGDLVLRDWMERIRAMVDGVDGPDQLRDRLLAAYGDLPGAELVELMALAFAAAELAGMDAVAVETTLQPEGAT
ncbi:DUF935 domain-containing protein [Variovorax sp. LT1R20]|uniref:DUF935 domain-containing protein n=1 Tax=Variovorax sp. LT1R20 TaxID=3443729 RepID=UPI003F484AE9